MSDATPYPIRALLCIAVTQNFFDLPGSEIGTVWKAVGEMLKGVNTMPGLRLLGTMDDDETMVGTSPSGWPWTCYLLVEAADRQAVVNACNLFRTIQIGEYRLWKYLRVEARLGRELAVPA
ncbi:hypothetical protein [Pseudoxanthomonas winnipegensis]|jgi:hypothetical protein|uniref:IacB n=1 Tax=Pseudoxanthomonas winnipegensis TaxID=2480810 RepID=A0A4Q8LCC8_9GAMM|nr:hypothetical protein [Pseudoxanthomonas winnipegensis]PZP61584.1 MAG: hypothetical protein DI597_08595 [Pseudoxanthomonas spadix]TAA26527.1 hypothetical protein EA660_04645 [Pseudoxanthomonas winnipegensis]